MKNFLRDHPETTLIVLALFFLAMIIGFYFWGVSDMAVTINRAMNDTPPPPQNVGFNLQDAAHLDLRGLVK